jgi:hypothetical protein
VHRIAFIDQGKEASDALHDHIHARTGFCAGDVLPGGGLGPADLEVFCIADL